MSRFDVWGYVGCSEMHLTLASVPLDCLSFTPSSHVHTDKRVTAFSLHLKDTPSWGTFVIREVRIAIFLLKGSVRAGSLSLVKSTERNVVAQGKPKDIC